MVKKFSKIILLLPLILSIDLMASSLNYCGRSELQFSNTYASTIINPVNWKETTSASVVFGFKPIYQDENTFKKENYLVNFSYQAKKEKFLILRGDIRQINSPIPENNRQRCWSTSLYFTYDLTNPQSYPTVTTLEGKYLPMIGDNLIFKSCELLSRTENSAGNASHNEIISGVTEEGDQYNFWITYAKPNSLLKAFEGQSSRNAQTVFFETVGLKN